MPVNRYETLLFALFAVLWLAVLGLYHLMISAVNTRVPESDRIPHLRISQRGRRLRLSHRLEANRIKNEYRRLYPSGYIYRAWVACFAAVIVAAIAFVGLRVWEYTHGRLP